MLAAADSVDVDGVPLRGLHGTLDAVAAPVLLRDRARIVGANDAMCRLLARPLAELLASDAQGWAVPAQRTALLDYTDRCLASADPQPALELEALTAYGSVRHLEITGRRLVTDAGTLVLITCTDLSDMRHVQSSLQEVGRVMQQIIETDPVATFVIDAEHRVTHWNAACARLSAIPAHEMVGSTDTWRAFHAERRPTLADIVVDGHIGRAATLPHLGDVRASTMLPDTYECEAHLPDVGGQARWLHFTATPLRDLSGRVVGAIETLQDVTARHRAEEQLRRHKAELEQIVAERTAELLLTHHELDAFLENASVGIIATRGTRVTRSNRKFGEMFELADDELHGVDTRRFFNDEGDREQLDRLMRDTLSGGRSLAHEMRATTARGRGIWLQMIAYTADAGDPLAQVWWILQDRTEVMRAQEELVNNFRAIEQTNKRLEEAQNQLLQSEKMASIGQLAAGVAHEINNPIGFVNSNLGSLRRYVETLLAIVAAYGRHRERIDDAELARLELDADLAYMAEDLPALLRESEDGLLRVKKIVQDLRDFSRVDSADWQDADINAGIESTLNVVLNEVKYRADVARNYGTLPPVRCLAGQLNQVFMNLIVNAAHAMDSGTRGLITLSSRCEARDGVDGVVIEVADNGRGMTPEVQRRVFEPFFTTKPVGQGTGLGLSLSFSIVKKHGGSIDLQSQPGAGTRFSVWVPVVGPLERAA